MTPCSIDKTHRIHHLDRSVFPEVSCKNYLAASDELKGHEANCAWEGYLSIKKCKCTPVSTLLKKVKK